MAQADQCSITSVFAAATSLDTGPDAALLTLCRAAEAIEIKIDATYEIDDEDHEDLATDLSNTLHPLHERIVNMRAHTLAGAVAKARRVSWCRDGDLSGEMDDPGTDGEMMISLVRDLLAIES